MEVSVRYKRKMYTNEQKIIVATWYHEKNCTGMTIEKLKRNFEIRFRKKFPTLGSIRLWEQRLFKHGLVTTDNVRIPKTSALVYIPYIKESVQRFPEMSMRARALFLGIPITSLFYLIKKDFHLVGLNAKGLCDKKSLKKLTNTADQKAEAEGDSEENNTNTSTIVSEICE